MIAKFAEYRDQLDKADGVTLANALRVTVVSIQIEARACTTGGIEHNEYYGELRFHPGFGVKKPVAIPDEALGHRKIWREIAALAKNLDRPLRLKDVRRCRARRTHRGQATTMESIGRTTEATDAKDNVIVV